MKPMTPISPEFSLRQSLTSPSRTISLPTSGPGVQPHQKLNPLNREAAESTGRGVTPRFEQVLSDAQKRSTLRDVRQRLRDDPPVKTLDLKSKQVESKNKKEEGLDKHEAVNTRKADEKGLPTEQMLVMEVGEQPVMHDEVGAGVNEAGVRVNQPKETPPIEVTTMLADSMFVSSAVETAVAGDSIDTPTPANSELQGGPMQATDQASQSALAAQAMTDVAVNVHPSGTKLVTDQQKQLSRQAVTANSNAEGKPADATSHVGHVQNEMNVKVVNRSPDGQTSEQDESEQGDRQGQAATANSSKAQPPGAGAGAGTTGANAAMHPLGDQGQTVMQTAQPTTNVNNPSQTTATAASSFTQVTSTMQQGQGAMSEAGTQGDVNAARIARGLQSALAQRGGTVTLRLHPPELGILRVQMQIQEGQVRAQFMTENAAARGF